MSGVWIVGPSRSGTSMVAGLFAQHGVFFGRCIRGNEYNPKGYFENAYLKRVMKHRNDLPDAWPDEWWEALRKQGWDGSAPWGVKSGPRQAPVVLPMAPSLLVFCRRPIHGVIRSRHRVPWASAPARHTTQINYDMMDDLANRLDVPTFDIETDQLVAGERDQLRPAFEALGIDLDLDIVDEWIDPSIWGRE